MYKGKAIKSVCIYDYAAISFVKIKKYRLISTYLPTEIVHS